MGQWLTPDFIKVRGKLIQTLFCTELPSNYDELKYLMGRLKFCSLEMSDYKRLVKPIGRLLQWLGQVWWSKENMETLKTLAYRVWTQLCIVTINIIKPA